MDTEKKSAGFQFIPASFTPFRSDGSVHYEVLPEYADYLCSQGAYGVFVNGTTGEGMSLTTQERMSIAEAWMKNAGEKLWVCIHVGHTSYPEARHLAAHAESIGADAIASMGPTFFEASSGDSLSGMLGQIAAAASSTPFFYYHMPSMARVSDAASALSVSLAETIPTYAGIKYTHEDLEDFEQCVRSGRDGARAFFGRDELLLAGLQAGAHGAVGSTFNFLIPHFKRMVEASENGNSTEAERLQRAATTIINQLVSAGGLPAIRAMTERVGPPLGPPRLPLSPVSSEVIDRLDAIIREAES